MSLRALWTVLLIGAIALSFGYSARVWQSNKEEIVLQLAGYFDTLALPYRVARLTALPEVTELPVPVLGVRLRTIADTWGEARSEGRSHEGTDIFAARGTPVFSATSGYVLRTGENRLGGIVVVTIGPGGVRYYYAHLDRIADGITFGMPVTTDTVLGYVGNTGNAAGTPPHLHFGIYTNEGPKNPYPYLVDR